MNKHTPGPWSHTSSKLYVPCGFAPEIFDSTGRVIARAYAWFSRDLGRHQHSPPPTQEQMETRRMEGNANAALIAAAPMLLNACKRATDLCECNGPTEPCDICKGLYEAINDAEGKS